MDRADYFKFGDWNAICAYAIAPTTFVVTQLT